MFRELTEENDKFNKICENNNKNSTTIMTEIDKEMNKVKFKAFGKVTVRNELKTSKVIKTLQAQKVGILEKNEKSKGRDDEIQSIDDQITENLISTQRRQLEKELSELKDMKNRKGKSAVIFNLKDKVIGKKKAGQEATTMKHPTTKKLLTNKKEIREESLNYCVDLLTNRKPAKGFEEDVRVKDMIHDARMRETIENDIEFSNEMFEKSLKGLKKNSDKYQFILQGGKSLKEALFSLFNLVWQTEEKPDQWRKTVIIQLYKGKGEKNEYGKQRNIHTKLDVPKFFSHTVMNQAKGKIIENMTKFQIGTKTGHRAQEHLFTLKSIISLNLYLDLPLVTQLYDISKFFDRESLRDGMNSIYNCGIQGKLYRLIYNMNKDTKIKVRTAIGETEEKDTGENIGQGTLEGAVISAANIDYTVDIFFRESTDELSYGGIKLQPFLFQDNISRQSTSVWAVQSGNNKIEAVMETKLLDFNLDKSCYIVMGSKKKNWK